MLLPLSAETHALPTLSPAGSERLAYKLEVTGAGPVAFSVVMFRWVRRGASLRYTVDLLEPSRRSPTPDSPPWYALQAAVGRSAPVEQITPFTYGRKGDLEDDQ